MHVGWSCKQSLCKSPSQSLILTPTLAQRWKQTLKEMIYQGHAVLNPTTTGVKGLTLNIGFVPGVVAGCAHATIELLDILDKTFS